MSAVEFERVFEMPPFVDVVVLNPDADRLGPRVALTSSLVDWIVLRSGLALQPPRLPHPFVAVSVDRTLFSWAGPAGATCAVCRRRIQPSAACMAGCGREDHLSHAECYACLVAAGTTARCPGELRPDGPLCAGSIRCELTARRKAAIDALVLPRLEPGSELVRALSGPAWLGFGSSVWVKRRPGGAARDPRDPHCRVCGMRAPRNRKRHGTCDRHWAHHACYAYFREAQVRAGGDAARAECPCALFPPV